MGNRGEETGEAAGDLVGVVHKDGDQADQYEQQSDTDHDHRGHDHRQSGGSRALTRQHQGHRTNQQEDDLGAEEAPTGRCHSPGERAGQATRHGDEADQSREHQSADRPDHDPGRGKAQAI